MTTQEAYEAIRAFFSKPGAQLAKSKSTSTNPGCWYRMNRGTNSPVRCAIGCILPDEAYDPEMEGHPLGGLIDKELFPKAHAFFSNFNGTTKDFLRNAQVSHDSYSETAEEFIANLDHIAVEHFGLTPVAA